MRWLITDFKRALTERTFLASIGIGVVALIIGLIVYLADHDNYQAQDAFITSQSLILPFIAPILAALPYSNMSMLEKDTGFKRLLLTKNNMKDYKFKRFIVNGIAAGIAVSLPLILLFLGCFTFSEYTDIQGVIGVIALDFLFGVSYGCIAYGLTFVNTKRYIPLVAPQVVYLLFIYAFPYLSLEKFYPPLTFSPWLLPSYVEVPLLMVQFAVLIGSTLVMMISASVYEKIQGLR